MFQNLTSNDPLIHIIDTYTYIELSTHNLYLKFLTMYFTFETSDLQNCIKSSTCYTELISSMFHTIYATIAIPGA